MKNCLTCSYERTASDTGADRSGVLEMIIVWSGYLPLRQYGNLDSND